MDGVGELSVAQFAVLEAGVAQDDSGPLGAGGDGAAQGEQLEVGESSGAIVPEVEPAAVDGDGVESESAGEDAPGLVFEDDVVGFEDEIVWLVGSAGQVESQALDADLAKDGEGGVVEFDVGAGFVFECVYGLEAHAFVTGEEPEEGGQGGHGEQQEKSGGFSAAPASWGMSVRPAALQVAGPGP